MFYPKEDDWDRRFEQYKRYIKKTEKESQQKQNLKGKNLEDGRKNSE